MYVCRHTIIMSSVGYVICDLEGRNDKVKNLMGKILSGTLKSQVSQNEISTISTKLLALLESHN